jgi:hypothetical protein
MLLAQIAHTQENGPSAAAPIPISYQNNDTFIGKEKQKRLMESQYCTIGQTLSMLEASLVRAGVPWIPPCSRVSELKRKLSDPLEDILKVELVNVQTSALESYIDDLESLPPTPSSSEQLYLTLLRPWERFCFAAILGIVSVSFGLCGSLSFAASIATIVLSVGFTTMAGVMVGTVLCSEGYRRASFQSLLALELMRRSGHTSQSTPFTPVGAEPLTD